MVKRTKKLLSLLTAAALSASAFASLIVPASAEEGEPVAPMAEPGEVLYTQDYQNAETVDWKTGTGGRYDPILDTEGENKYMTVEQSTSQRNNNGATLSSTTTYGSYVEGLNEYAVEFDAKLGSANNQANADLRINTGDGYLFSIHQTGNSSTTWYLNGNTSAVVDLPGTGTNTAETLEDGIRTLPWYHFTVAFKKGATYLTIKNAEGELLADAEGNPVADKMLLEPKSTTGALTNMTFATGRYYSNLALDNIVIRALNEGEIPDVEFHTITINTTRYAKMTTSDEKTFYADVNGVITMTNQTVGTSFTYTLEKTGYDKVEGSITVANEDIIENKQLTITDKSKIFVESDFGNAAGTYQTAKGDRLTSIGLGQVELPAMSTISMDVTVEGSEETVLSILLKNSAGKDIVGLQGVTADGALYAFTGFTGSASDQSDINQYASVGKYTHGDKLADNYTGTYTVEFVVDKDNKNVTARIGDNAVSLPIVGDPIDLASISVGKYRNNAAVTIDNITIEEPDPNYVQVSGDAALAKVSGKTITRTYTASPAAPVPDETFTWTVADAEGQPITGVTIDPASGVLSVTDEATPGTAVVTATSSAGDGAKKGTINVAINDFSNVTAAVDGPKAYVVGGEGAYEVTSLVDDYSDDVIELFTPEFSSEDEQVIKVDAATGEAEALSNGSTNIVIKVGNPGKEAEIKIPVTVATYYITQDVAADAAATEIDLTDIVKTDKYLVTTSKDGKLVNQEEVDAPASSGGVPTTKTVAKEAGIKITATYENEVLKTIAQADVAEGEEIDLTPADENTKVFFWTGLDTMKPAQTETKTIGEEGDTAAKITVDTTGADKVEVAPIFTGVMNTEYAVPSDRYNVTITAGNGRRTDVYVNDQMMFNNVNQGSDNWTIGRIFADSTDYTAEDVVIGEGYAKFNYRDDQSGGSLITAVKFVKAPSIVTRAKRIYAIGDSLVAKYYGTAPEGQEGLVRTGWGDVLQNYIADGVKVTNLGNSGAWAAGMVGDAFTNVIYSAQPGDVVIWESGYNDSSHGGAEPMKEAMTTAAQKCKEMNVDIYFVTPNASSHDYNNSVHLAEEIRNLGTELEVPVIDLSAMSYEFLNSKYSTLGDNLHTLLRAIYNNSGDTLHSTYNAANCWAAIVAQGLPEELTNKTYTYTFNDAVEGIEGVGNDITVGVGLMLPPVPAE